MIRYVFAAAAAFALTAATPAFAGCKDCKDCPQHKVAAAEKAEKPACKCPDGKTEHECKCGAKCECGHCHPKAEGGKKT